MKELFRQFLVATARYGKREKFIGELSIPFNVWLYSPRATTRILGITYPIPHKSIISKWTWFFYKQEQVVNTTT